MAGESVVVTARINAAIATLVRILPQRLVIDGRPPHGTSYRKESAALRGNGRWTGATTRGRELIELLFAGSWNAGAPAIPIAVCIPRSRVDGARPVEQPAAAGRAGADINTLELSLLRNFRKYAHGQPAPGIDSIWHWLALGQHHGLPTRLIDWTYSPFVALHFATEHPDEYDRDGIVWCVNFVEANKLLPRRLKAILEEEQSETFTIDMLTEFQSLQSLRLARARAVRPLSRAAVARHAHPESVRAVLADARSDRRGLTSGSRLILTSVGASWSLLS